MLCPRLHPEVGEMLRIHSGSHRDSCRALDVFLYSQDTAHLTLRPHHSHTQQVQCSEEHSQPPRPNNPGLTHSRGPLGPPLTTMGGPLRTH